MSHIGFRSFWFRDSRVVIFTFLPSFESAVSTVYFTSHNNNVHRSAVCTTQKSKLCEKVSRSPCALSLSLSPPLSLSKQTRIQNMTTVFYFIFYAVLVDEGREDPNTTKAGRHRPASETPFDGLGSSREH